MQKFLASILLLLYSTANFGLSLRLDYCGDSIYSFAFFSDEKNLAECCLAMGAEDDCCDSEQIYLQESSDKIQKTSTLSAPIVGAQDVDARFFQTRPCEAVLKPQHLAIESKVPPLKQRRHAAFSCFLI